MAAKNIAVFGIYPDQLTAEDAVDTLKDAGFRNTDISVLFPDNQGTKDFAHEKHTKAPEGAVTGGSSGAVIGGALGWLAGIGALAIPGLSSAWGYLSTKRSVMKEGSSGVRSCSPFTATIRTGRAVPKTS
jgi:hypothetical protein